MNLVYIIVGETIEPFNCLIKFTLEDQKTHISNEEIFEKFKSGVLKKVFTDNVFKPDTLKVYAIPNCSIKDTFLNERLYSISIDYLCDLLVKHQVIEVDMEIFKHLKDVK